MSQISNMFDAIMPQRDRCRYDKAPLDRVIAQLRYDPVLEIAVVPHPFQALVRGSYPGYATEPRETTVTGGLPLLTDQQHAFGTHDGREKLVLATDAITLETRQYTVFEDFQARFAFAQRALRDTYGVEQFSRIGLRYVDRFDFPFNGLQAHQAINPLLLGLFQDEQLRVGVREYQAQQSIDFGTGTAMVRTMLRRNPENDQVTVVLDTDCFRVAGATRMNASDAERDLELFHSFAWRFFRWSIKEELHERLDPTPI